MTEKQKCIKEYYSNLSGIQRTFDLSFCQYDTLPKSQKKFLRYKFACIDSHPDCSEIPKHKRINDFEACQVKCKYSYDYSFD